MWVNGTVPINVGNKEKEKKDVSQGLWIQIIQRIEWQSNCGYPVVTFILVISPVFNVQCHGNAMETKKGKQCFQGNRENEYWKKPASKPFLQ